tara:strand:- start:665 stop:2179 length:1515 start_codon:yes stop_codon:yes gene_type:complete
MPQDSIQLGPWHGGVRYDLPAEEVGVNEISDMQNTRIGQAGEVESRPGTDSYEDAASIGGSTSITMAAEFDVDASTTHVVMVGGTAIYKYADGWTTITGSVTATAGNDNTWEWVNANGTLVATNGVDTNAWKWTGTGNAADLDDDSRFTKGKHIAWFDNRLWIGNVNGATGQLWYSDTADIETWGGTSFFNFGGIVTALRPRENDLAVHTTIGIYTLTPTGNATNPYHPVRKVKEGDGIVDNGRIVANLPSDTQVTVRKDGIYEWTGGSTLNKISGPLDAGGLGYWAGVNKDRLKQAFTLVFPRENECWFFLPHGLTQTNCNNVMIWNYAKRRWHGPYTGWERNYAALINNKPHAGDFAGLLMDHDTNDKSDDGASIVSYFETGSVAPYGTSHQLGWIRGRHYYNAEGQYTVQVSQKGYNIAGEPTSLDLMSDGFQLNGSTLMDGQTPFKILLQLPQDLPLLGYAPSCGIRYTQNKAGEKFTIRRVELTYDTLGLQPMPKPADK